MSMDRVKHAIAGLKHVLAGLEAKNLFREKGTIMPGQNLAGSQMTGPQTSSTAPAYAPGWVHVLSHEIENIWSMAATNQVWVENGSVYTGVWQILAEPALSINMSFGRGATTCTLVGKNPKGLENKSIIRDALVDPGANGMVQFTAWLVRVKNHIETKLDPSTVPVFGSNLDWIYLEDFGVWGNLNGTKVMGWHANPPVMIMAGPYRNPNLPPILPPAPILPPSTIEAATDLAMETFQEFGPVKKYWDVSVANYNVEIKILNEPETSISMMRNKDRVEVSVLVAPNASGMQTAMVGYEELPLPDAGTPDLIDYQAWFSLVMQAIETRINLETVKPSLTQLNGETLEEQEWVYLPDLKAWVYRYNKRSEWVWGNPPGNIAAIEAPDPFMDPANG